MRVKKHHQCVFTYCDCFVFATHRIKVFTHRIEVFILIRITLLKMTTGSGPRRKEGRDGGINRGKWAGRRDLRTLLWTLSVECRKDKAKIKVMTLANHNVTNVENPKNQSEFEANTDTGAKPRITWEQVAICFGGFG